MCTSCGFAGSTLDQRRNGLLSCSSRPREERPSRCHVGRAETFGNPSRHGIICRCCTRSCDLRQCARTTSPRHFSSKRAAANPQAWRQRRTGTVRGQRCKLEQTRSWQHPGSVRSSTPFSEDGTNCMVTTPSSGGVQCDVDHEGRRWWSSIVWRMSGNRRPARWSCVCGAAAAKPAGKSL